MIRTYNYTIEGIGAGGAAWAVSGTVTCEMAQAFNASMKETFAALTEGKAEYGKPGPCGGPFTIDRVVLQRETS